MNPWRWVDPRVGEVKIDQIKHYLTTRGWRESPGGPSGYLRYQAPSGGNGSDGRSCVLPNSDQAADYALSLTYFLTSLSEMEDRHPVSILEEILNPMRTLSETARAQVNGS